MFHPKVSIVIPVYNGSKYMREAIDSALAQTYDNFEIIVVNDGSTDNTEEIALSYGEKISYFSKENGGQSSALNYGIEKMTGEYFSWLSHDDVYYREKIEKQINFLNEIGNISNVIIYSAFEIINERSENIRSVIKPSSYDNLRFSLILEFAISGCTLLIPKVAFDKIGNFNPKRPHTSDYQLWFEIATSYSFKYFPEVLVKSRIHAEQMSNKKEYHEIESSLFLTDALQNILSNDYNEVLKEFKSKNRFLKIVIKRWVRGYKIKAISFALMQVEGMGIKLYFTIFTYLGLLFVKIKNLVKAMRS